MLMFLGDGDVVYCDGDGNDDDQSFADICKEL